jgi:DNA-binding CsgD family transcriptional regulator
MKTESERSSAMILPLPVDRRKGLRAEATMAAPPTIVEFDRDRARSFALAAWMSQERQVRLIVTPDMTIVWMNSSAEAFAKNGGVFHIAAGRLWLDVPLLHERMTRFDPGARGWIHVDGPDGEEYIAWIRDIPTAAGRFLGLAISANRKGCPGALASQFNLSMAESRVIGALLEGKSPKSIASTLGLTIATVKSHISHAYEKIGVRTRGEMFAKASLFDE